MRRLPAAIRFECDCKLDARGSAFLELSGELDRAVCGEFEARLAEAQRASSDVALDLRRLTFMDGAGYTVLARAAEASMPETKIFLTGCAGQVSRLLNLVGLPEKVEIRRSPQPLAGAIADCAETNRSGAAIGA
ncbi:MAG TPA: STAS domain-containing protein [Solirubrobacterales bacterium]|nr:STAS domain-containing protein [Solirubrobacterales bacterium]